MCRSAISAQIGSIARGGAQTLKHSGGQRSIAQRPREQGSVNAYFHSHAAFWRDVYASGGVQAEIYQARHATTLAWIDSLSLAPGARVLEIGCGAGHLAVALAQRGLCVHAIDSATAMVDLTRQHAAESGVTETLRVETGDTSSLRFADESFDLVLAIGVIPWLQWPELAVQEMARVVRSGGYVILTADNWARLTHLLDPGFWLMPVISPLKQRIRDTVERIEVRRWPPDEISATFHRHGTIDRMLSRRGLVKVRGITIGFGPFRFLGRPVIPESWGIPLHYQLQRLADRDMPIMRSTGAQYLVLAMRPISLARIACASGQRSIPDPISYQVRMHTSQSACGRTPVRPYSPN